MGHTSGTPPAHANCSLLDPALFRVVQVGAWPQIHQYLETTTNLAHGKVTGVLRRFSYYAVAWVRRRR